MANRFRKYIAALLLVIFGMLILPKELWHEIQAVQHADTTDIHCDCNIPHLDVQHQHCEVLQLASPVFSGFPKPYFTPEPLFLGFVYYFFQTSNGIEPPELVCLRGPPLV